MPVTMQDVRRLLDSEEPDYRAAARLGPDALPHLKQLARSQELLLASKAVYLASLIQSDVSVRIVEAAAARPEPVVRVAAASGLKNHAENAAASLADRLPGDTDSGVRKFAVKSAGAFSSPAMRLKLRAIADRDPSPSIRTLAARYLPK